jgi:hypothetical protein
MNDQLDAEEQQGGTFSSLRNTIDSKKAFAASQYTTMSDLRRADKNAITVATSLTRAGSGFLHERVDDMADTIEWMRGAELTQTQRAACARAYTMHACEYAMHAQTSCLRLPCTPIEPCDSHLNAISSEGSWSRVSPSHRNVTPPPYLCRTSAVPLPRHRRVSLVDSHQALPR